MRHELCPHGSRDSTVTTAQRSCVKVGVETEVRVDDDHVLVHAPHVADVGRAGAENRGGGGAGGELSTPLGRGHPRERSPAAVAGARPRELG